MPTFLFLPQVNLFINLAHIETVRLDEEKDGVCWVYCHETRNVIRLWGEDCALMLRTLISLEAAAADPSPRLTAGLKRDGVRMCDGCAMNPNDIIGLK